MPLGFALGLLVGKVFETRLPARYASRGAVAGIVVLAIEQHWYPMPAIIEGAIALACGMWQGLGGRAHLSKRHWPRSRPAAIAAAIAGMGLGIGCAAGFLNPWTWAVVSLPLSILILLIAENRWLRP